MVPKKIRYKSEQGLSATGLDASDGNGLSCSKEAGAFLTR